MNQKKAKLLRRTAGFKVHDVREYDERIRKRDREGKVASVQRICTGARAIYQSMKRGAK